MKLINDINVRKTNNHNDIVNDLTVYLRSPIIPTHSKYL